MQERIEELRECFAEVDANADGGIQYDEFATMLHNLGSQMSTSECKLGFKEVDSNSDGTISFDEFAAWWLDH
ncbi:MAG: Ca2+-binding EF-hand superfamily protein [Limisphaerales bacterium]|jgi:Ca2+-binding EF-hand superfamily protein